MTVDRLGDSGPLVVHIVPSPRGRGAELAARMLVDQLDEPGVVRHRLLGLFAGPPEVALDVSLDHHGGNRPTEGFEPRLALRLRRVLTHLDPVAVVACGGDAMKYAVPAVIGTARPLVYCVIGTYMGPPTALRVSVWKHIMARADLVVPVGDEVLDESIERFAVSPDRAIVIPNGRDPSLYRPRSDEAPSTNHPRLIFVGALTAQKQPDRFIEVVARLRAQGRSITAQMVGDGPLADALAPSAAEQGIELLGSRADVPELLRNADVLVLTSRPPEGMPGVLIEAGLSGLPAVSTPVPGAATVIDDGRTGLIVDDSAATVADAVGQLLDDPARRAAMGACARIRCESEFSLALMANRWHAVLQPLVDGQARTGRRGAPGLPGRSIARRAAARSRLRNSQR
jgi:glycosyltransferase involved in cell wall biosynthesis